jgi:hypothetical protein
MKRTVQLSNPHVRLIPRMPTRRIYNTGINNRWESFILLELSHTQGVPCDWFVIYNIYG